ncbi:MAG: hypothetical protein WBZ36_23280 [Candidatus Nitrosopolaris sp.]
MTGGVAYYNKKRNSYLLRSYARKATLRSFKNAENGTAGSIVEQFNGTKLITYQPVKLHSTTWAILLMQPVPVS